MEIELTSQRDDETWTWRAAGARQPRGLIAASMVGNRPKVGDQLRVEAEVELEGITIVSVLPSRDRPAAADRIELLAAPPVEAVTTSLVSRAPSRNRRPSDGERDRADRPSGPRRDAPRDAPRRGADRAPREPRPDAPLAAERTERRPPRTDQRPPRPPRPVEAGATRPPRPPRPTPQSGAAEAPTRTRTPRFSPHSVHRDALIGGLAPEERPVAEQLAAGGLPAVRRALAAEQEAAKAAGRPPLGGEAIIALAEQLLPRVHEATWLDRAESAVEQLTTLSLRDLRATIAGAAPRDDVGRELLRQLRAAYDERLPKLRTTWEHEIAHALEERRVLQALRVSARLPEPSARFPAALVQPLAEAASGALTDATSPERWLALLEAAAASPVRRLVKPAGIPEDPTGTVRQAATVAAGSVPALAALLGLAMPPPPRPAPGSPVRPPTTTRPRPRRGAAGAPTAPRRDTRPIPPPPTLVPPPSPVSEVPDVPEVPEVPEQVQDEPAVSDAAAPLEADTGADTTSETEARDLLTPVSEQGAPNEESAAATISEQTPEASPEVAPSAVVATEPEDAVRGPEPAGKLSDAREATTGSDGASSDGASSDGASSDDSGLDGASIDGAVLDEIGLDRTGSPDDAVVDEPLEESRGQGETA